MLNKKVYVILIMIVIILGISIETLAFDLSTNIDKQSLEENQVKVSLELIDLEDYTKGINVVSGKLIYDTNVFESVSVKGMNNWSCAYNNEKGNESQGKFILMTTSGNATEDKEVAQLELKLKPGVKQEETTIKIEGIETSYNSEKINTEDKEIKLKLDGNKINLVKDTDSNIKEKDYSIYIFIAIILIVVVIIIITILKLKKRGEKNEK